MTSTNKAALRLTTKAADLTSAAELIKAGKLVVFPTDTVYGIGCDAWDAVAIETLYAAKARERIKGLPILISDLAVLARVMQGRLSSVEQQLVQHFWPGGLTLIVTRHPDFPANIAPNDTIAVRLPGLESCRTFIRAAGGVVAVSSANVSGYAAAVSAADAVGMLSTRVAAIVDGGLSMQTLPSTIVDCRGEQPYIIRAGSLDITQFLQRIK